MAFTPATFVPQSAMGNSGAPRVFSYSTAETLATAKGANYFDPAAAAAGMGLKDLDVILVNASDGVSFLSMSITAGAATVGAANDFI